MGAEGAQNVSGAGFEGAGTGEVTQKKTKKMNRAAPVIQHPVTMHRMQVRGGCLGEGGGGVGEGWGGEGIF